jgi:hypothetical protein
VASNVDPQLGQMMLPVLRDSSPRSAWQRGHSGPSYGVLFMAGVAIVAYTHMTTRVRAIMSWTVVFSLVKSAGI